jgi:hypothetical protein
MRGSSESKLTLRKRRRWFIPRLLIVLVCSAGVQLILPWWGILPVCALIGFLTAPINHSPFLAGFIALFIVWAGYAGFIDYQNESILSARVIRLFPVPHHSFVLLLLTGILGGLMGGMSTLTGHTLRRFLQKEDLTKRYY